MLGKLLVYGAIGYGAFLALNHFDFKLPNAKESKYEQYVNDKFWGKSILDGMCDASYSKQFESCSSPRMQGMIKNSDSYDPRIVKRWKETFFEEYCQPDRLRTYKKDKAHEWCQPYTKYVVDYKQSLASALDGRDARTKFILKDDKYRHYCYYYNERGKTEKFHSVCPGIVIRDLEAASDDWSVIK